MATPLDFGLIEQISSLFPFLLSFAVTFAILNKTKFIEGATLQAFVAIVISFMLILSPFVTRLIREIAPWFVLLFIFLILTTMLFMIFGTEEQTLKNVGKDPAFMWAMIIISLVIIVASASKAYYVEGENLDPTINASDESPDNYVPYKGEQIYWLYHPRMLGLIMIFLIGTFTIRLLSGTNPN